MRFLLVNLERCLCEIYIVFEEKYFLSILGVSVSFLLIKYCALFIPIILLYRGKS